MFSKTFGLFLILISVAFAQNKITLAVMDLDAEGISASENRIISARLRTELIETQKFTVVEREKVEEILSEQGFQLSGCTSNECAVQAGKLLGVKYMAVGSIGKIGAIFTLNIRLINVESGVVMKTAVEDCKCSIDQVLTEAVRKTAKKLAGIQQIQKLSNKKQSNTASPPPVRKKQTITYNPPKKEVSKSRFFIGMGFGNGQYILATPLGLKNDIHVPLKPIVELSIGFRVIKNLWLGYALKNHKFNEVWSADRYEGELAMHYPRIQYYIWRWVYFSYGYVFKELSFKKTPTGITSPLSKKFYNDDPLNLISVGSTMKIGSLFAINVELSVAKNYFTAGYDIYLMF